MRLARLLAKGGLREFATATPATPATHQPSIGLSVATVATVAVAKAPDGAANDFRAPDPDRSCWPHSTAMNTVELDAFTARLARITDKGLTLADAESMTDMLVIRDRDADDRRLCLECVHLTGRRAGAWHCNNWRQAEIAIQARGAQLSGDLVRLLQRCDGFSGFLNHLTEVTHG